LQEELKVLEELQKGQEQKHFPQLQLELKEILASYLADKQEQLTNLRKTATFVPDAQEKIDFIQEEIKTLQEELEKAEKSGQQARVQFNNSSRKYIPSQK